MKKLILVIFAVVLIGCESNSINPTETDTHVGMVRPCFVLTVKTMFGESTFYSLHTWTNSEERLLYVFTTDSTTLNLSLDELEEFEITVGNY